MTVAMGAALKVQVLRVKLMVKVPGKLPLPENTPVMSLVVMALAPAPTSAAIKTVGKSWRRD